MSSPAPRFATRSKHKRAWLDEAAEVARAAAPGIDVTVHVGTQDEATLLIEESREARLMVLGSQGLGGVTDLLVGSTALALASHGQCPLVVVRGTTHPEGPVIVGAASFSASDDLREDHGLCARAARNRRTPFRPARRTRTIWQC